MMAGGVDDGGRCQVVSTAGLHPMSLHYRGAALILAENNHPWLMFRGEGLGLRQLRPPLILNHHISHLPLHGGDVPGLLEIAPPKDRQKEQAVVMLHVVVDCDGLKWSVLKPVEVIQEPVSPITLHQLGTHDRLTGVIRYTRPVLIYPARVLRDQI
jgi:hypothetical protein